MVNNPHKMMWKAIPARLAPARRFCGKTPEISPIMKQKLPKIPVLETILDFRVQAACGDCIRGLTKQGIPHLVKSGCDLMQFRPEKPEKPLC